MSSTSSLRNILGWIGLAGAIVAGVLVWNNRLTLADDFRLWNYMPPSDVAALSQAVGFTDQGQQYFYASHPRIEDKSQFNADCGKGESHSAILGCYTKDTIYIYNITDARLNGVQEVTAAHETLHAAYERLGQADRTAVDSMLLSEYDAMKNNPDFAERFSVYNSLSQADKLNELHSIFGTEVASLPSNLESYYARFFKNRGAVTADYNAYQGQFTALKARQNVLKTQIDSLRSEVATLKAKYTADRASLDTDVQAFRRRSESGGYTSAAQFGADQNALNARISALNATAAEINGKIDESNGLINEYNQLSVQTEDLQKSLDSNSVESNPGV